MIICVYYYLFCNVNQNLFEIKVYFEFYFFKDFFGFFFQKVIMIVYSEKKCFIINYLCN